MPLPPIASGSLSYCPCCGLDLRALAVSLQFLGSGPGEKRPPSPPRDSGSNGDNDRRPPAPPDPTFDGRSPRKRFTPEQRAEITLRIAALKKAGMERAAICKELNIGTSSYERLKPHGADGRAKGRPVKASKLPEEVRASVRALKDEGVTVKRIGQRLNITNAAVRSVLYYQPKREQVAATVPQS